MYIKKLKRVSMNIKFFDLPVFIFSNLYNSSCRVCLSMMFYIYILERDKNLLTTNKKLILPIIIPSIFYFLVRIALSKLKVDIYKLRYILFTMGIAQFFFVTTFDLLTRPIVVIVFVSSFQQAFFAFTDCFLHENHNKIKNAASTKSYLYVLLYRFMVELPNFVMAIIFDEFKTKRGLFSLFLGAATVFHSIILFILLTYPNDQYYIEKDQIVENCEKKSQIDELEINILYVVSCIKTVFVFTVIYMNFKNIEFLLYYFSFDCIIKILVHEIPPKLFKTFFYANIVLSLFVFYIVLQIRQINAYILLIICIFDGITHQLIDNTTNFSEIRSLFTDLIITLFLFFFAYTFLEKIDLGGIIFYSPTRI